MVYPCADPDVRRNASATPTFRDIVYENIVLRRGGLQMSVQGLPESPITGVEFINVRRKALHTRTQFLGAMKSLTSQVSRAGLFRRLCRSATGASGLGREAVVLGWRVRQGSAVGAVRARGGPLRSAHAGWVVSALFCARARSGDCLINIGVRVHGDAVRPCWWQPCSMHLSG